MHDFFFVGAPGGHREFVGHVPPPPPRSYAPAHAATVDPVGPR